MVSWLSYAMELCVVRELALVLKMIQNEVSKAMKEVKRKSELIPSTLLAAFGAPARGGKEDRKSPALAV